MRHIVERMSVHPAMVFSRSAELLLQNRPAAVVFGGLSHYPVHRWLVDPAASECYRHAELGDFELYRQLMVDPEDHQMLLVFTAVPGSPTDEKLRLLAAP